MKNNLVVQVVQGVILPCVIGFIISYYRNPYETASIVESNKGFLPGQTCFVGDNRVYLQLPITGRETTHDNPTHTHQKNKSRFLRLGGSSGHDEISCAIPTFLALY